MTGHRKEFLSRELSSISTVIAKPTLISLFNICFDPLSFLS
uniref:Uncharacterized protein n=1 Tax=Rhizophora mucronata TaxID=61149 RepID=A0A2P2P9E7_RHIMU